VDSLAAEAGFDPAGRSIAIVGAGGAASAALVSFALGKAEHIVMLNRSVEPAEELIERVQSFARETVLESAEMGDDCGEIVREADLVVNATPLGMNPGDKSPVPAEWLHSGQVVVDMVYRAQPTPLVQTARSVGATALDGLGMLVEQGAVALEIWWSDESCGSAPRDVMRRAAEDALRSLVPVGDDRA
jgi:shikimate dehydrogenase